MNRRGLDDDQPCAAGGAGAVIGHQVVGRQVVVDERGLVRRRDDAVLDHDRAECERREEVLEHGVNEISPAALMHRQGEGRV
jgi:hypothetical protein